MLTASINPKGRQLSDSIRTRIIRSKLVLQRVDFYHFDAIIFLVPLSMLNVNNVYYCDISQTNTHQKFSEISLNANHEESQVDRENFL